MVGHLVVPMELDHLRKQHKQVPAAGVIGVFSSEEFGDSGGNRWTNEVQDGKGLVELGREHQEVLDVRDVPAHPFIIVNLSDVSM